MGASPRARATTKPVSSSFLRDYRTRLNPGQVKSSRTSSQPSRRPFSQLSHLLNLCVLGRTDDIETPHQEILRREHWHLDILHDVLMPFTKAALGYLKWREDPSNLPTAGADGSDLPNDPLREKQLFFYYACFKFLCTRCWTRGDGVRLHDGYMPVTWCRTRGDARRELAVY